MSPDAKAFGLIFSAAVTVLVFVLILVLVGLLILLILAVLLVLILVGSHRKAPSHVFLRPMPLVQFTRILRIYPWPGRSGLPEGP